MEKNSIETFSKQSEIVQRDEMMEDVKTPPDLVQAVKQVSNNLTNDGEDLLLNELPKEILQLTEHIQNEELFRLSPKELEKELFGSIEEFAETIQNSTQNAKDFVKENRKDWEKWQKRQKKERKENHHITQKKKHSHPIQIKSFPENCKVPKNTKLEKLIEFVNDEMVTVNRLVTSIKLWISLKIPRIEDGNNVGVVVQEEHIGLLSGMESAVATVFSNSISYYSSRGEYINNIIANPGVEDYKMCLLHYDEWIVQQCKVYLYECRNSLALIYDRISKNINWLYTPRMESDVQHIFL